MALVTRGNNMRLLNGGKVRAMIMRGKPRKPFTPLDLFANNENGAWYDPSDFSTMFQDAAGTTPVTALEQPVGKILDKSGRGNNASQSTTTARPVLSARINQLLNTETLSTQSVTTVAATYTLAFSGSGTITLSGTKTGTYSAGSNTLTGVTAGTLTLTVSGTVTQADLRVANDGVGLPSYQRVAAATDYDSTGFPPYLKFDGVDDCLYTSAIDFTATDKMTVWGGVRKLSDAALGCITELSSGAVLRRFSLLASSNNAGTPGAYYLATLAGTTYTAYDISSYAAPITSVFSAAYNIEGSTRADEIKTRINGQIPTLSGAGSASAGTGTFGNYPLYIGRRNNAILQFNGRLYSLIVRGVMSTAEVITQAETWVNSKTRAYTS